MAFHLDDLRNDTELRKKSFDVGAFEIGYPYRFYFSFPIGLDEFLIPFSPILRGLMNEKQIDIIKAEPFEGFHHGVGIIVFARPKFG